MADAASEKPIINLWAEKIALGPIRRDFLPLYQRWMNDFEAIQYLGVQKRPMTAERETAWYDHAATDPTSADFTIYERATLRPIGNAGLHETTHFALPHGVRAGLRS